MIQVRDTSQDYDDLVGYKAKENETVDLSTFLDEEEPQETRKAPTKKIDPEYPEEWQTLYVNFKGESDYFKFMTLIGMQPRPNKSETIVYKKNADIGILGFFGD